MLFVKFPPSYFIVIDPSVATGPDVRTVLRELGTNVNSSGKVRVTTADSALTQSLLFTGLI